MPKLGQKLGKRIKRTPEEKLEIKRMRNREWARRNKEKKAIYNAARYQELRKDPEFMQKQREKTKKWCAAHPEYIKQRNEKRRGPKTEEEKERNRAWFAANKHKRRLYQSKRNATIRAAIGQVSDDIIDKLMALQKSKCACCRVKFTEKKWHLDHIMPISKGGVHDDFNLQLLCQTCNNEKYNHDPVDFMQRKGFLL